MILPEQKLDALVTRLKTIETELAAGPERDTYVRLSREFSELQPLVQTITAYRAVEGEIDPFEPALGVTLYATCVNVAATVQAAVMALVV